MSKQYFIKYKYQVKYDPTWYKVKIFVITKNIDDWWENYRQDYCESDLKSITYLGEVND